jgi:hypothetical protein
MRSITIIIFTLLLLAVGTPGQSELTRLVETEKAFARTAAEKNTKTAFLEFLADDAITFNPTAGNGKVFWRSRPDSPALLVWTPAFADISSNAVLGYTTGPWEFRAKGRDDSPSAFGHYVSIWQKQPDGNFKAVLDIGISHPAMPLVREWTSPRDSGRELNEKKISAADTSAQFYETAENQNAEKAYKNFFAEDGRLYRNGKFPVFGKKNALEEVKKTKDKIRFGPRSLFVSAADLAYTTNTYVLYDKTRTITENGNFVQIWKLRGGRWQIVLDLFNPLPK